MNMLPNSSSFIGTSIVYASAKARNTAKSTPQAQDSKTRAPAAYSSMALVLIGIIVGIVAAAAVLLIVTRRKR